MKAFLTFLGASAILISAASADWVIESKIENSQPKSPLSGVMTVKMKGDKMRMDTPGGPMGAMSTIMDIKTGETITLLPAQKMAMKMSGAAMKQEIDEVRRQGGVKEGVTPELKATGQTEKVGDIDCDIYTANNGTVTAKIWVARNHPQAAVLKMWEKQMRSGFFGGMKGGPDTTKLAGSAIKTESTGMGVTITSTLLSIKEQDVDAKEFEVPEGYQSVALPGALGGK